MIKTLLAPYEVYIWAGLAVLLLVTGVYEIHHLENIGVQRQLAADAKLADAQRVHTAEVEARAEALVRANDARLHGALVAPDPKPSVAVRVCPRVAAPRPPMSANGGTVSGGAGGPAAIPGAVGAESQGSGVDIAPSTEALLKRADAEIAYWREYYAACKAAGACK